MLKGTPNPWTFKTWIVNFKGVDLPIGDLAEDISKDPEFPTMDFFGDILEHISNKSHNNSVIIQTFIHAWSYYLATTNTAGYELQELLDNGLTTPEEFLEKARAAHY